MQDCDKGGKEYVDLYCDIICVRNSLTSLNIVFSIFV